MIQITDTITLEDWEITESFHRSSGPGGQNVNKVSTAVELRFEAARSPNLSPYVKNRLRTDPAAREIHFQCASLENSLSAAYAPPLSRRSGSSSASILRLLGNCFSNPAVSGNSITPRPSDNQLVRDGLGSPIRFALRARRMREWHDRRIQTPPGVARGLDEPPVAARDRIPAGGDQGVERAAG